MEEARAAPPEGAAAAPPTPLSPGAASEAALLDELFGSAAEVEGARGADEAEGLFGARETAYQTAPLRELLRESSSSQAVEADLLGLLGGGPAAAAPPAVDTPAADKTPPLSDDLLGLFDAPPPPASPSPSPSSTTSDLAGLFGGVEAEAAAELPFGDATAGAAEAPAAPSAGVIDVLESLEARRAAEAAEQQAARRTPPLPPAGASSPAKPIAVRFLTTNQLWAAVEAYGLEAATLELDRPGLIALLQSHGIHELVPGQVSGAPPGAG